MGIPGDTIADFRPDLKSEKVVYPAMTVIMMGQKNANRRVAVPASANAA